MVHLHGDFQILRFGGGSFHFIQHQIAGQFAHFEAGGSFFGSFLQGVHGGLAVSGEDGATVLLSGFGGIRVCELHDRGGASGEIVGFGGECQFFQSWQAAAAGGHGEHKVFNIREDSHPAHVFHGFSARAWIPVRNR